MNDNPELGTLGPNGGPTQTALPARREPGHRRHPRGRPRRLDAAVRPGRPARCHGIGNCTIGAVEGGFLIDTAALPDATPGRAYPPIQLTVQNEGTSTSPYQSKLKWQGLTLPSWLTLSPTGVLSGTTPKSRGSRNPLAHYQRSLRRHDGERWHHD